MIRQASCKSVGLILVALLLVGCGRTGHDRIEVTGLVTLDGRPLPSGLTVKFTPVNNDAPIGSGNTDTQSRYTAYAAPGKIGLSPGSYVVSVELPFADEPGPYTGPPDLANISIPPDYRTDRSTLTFRVPQDGHTCDVPMITRR